MTPDLLEVSLPQLRCFIAVVEAGSLAEAGRRLGMSAANVSKAVGRLEESIGVRLLHRSTHALSLTDEGERLLAPAREVLQAAQTFRDAAGTGEQASGVIRITAGVGITRLMLAPLLAELASTNPELRVDVVATNEMVDLADDGVDLAVRSGPLSGVPGHVQRPWFETPWIVCASPAYLARKPAPRTPSALAEHHLLGFRNTRTGQVQSWPLRPEGARASNRYIPDARLVFDDGDSAIGAAIAGGGIISVPLFLVAAELRAGHAVELLREWREANVMISLVRRERRLTPARVEKLCEFLLGRAPDLSDLV